MIICMLVVSLFTTIFEERRNVTKDEMISVGKNKSSIIDRAVVEDVRNDALGPTARAENNVLISAGINTTTSGGAECLSLDFEDTLDAIISNSRQVFITMPAKAAGTSLKRFTSKCTSKQQNVPDNFINNPTLSKNMLTDSFQLPSIIASHLYIGDKPLVDLVQHSTRQTLIVYVHRDETERLLSGIRHVLTSRVCSPERRVRSTVGGDTLFNIALNDTHCTLDEVAVVDLIEKRLGEVGMGSSDILTCKAYEAIEQNAPNMIFMHYTQANKLQKLLAKHHCPELVEETSRENTAKGKGMEVYLRLKKGKDIVNLDDWLKEKSLLLEWSLKLKTHASCQAKTRHMEDVLFACTDQTVKVSDILHW